jgi:uncharacterized protein with GYD domain
MIQSSYTPEAWAGMVKRPQDRSRMVRQVTKKMRGRMISFYYAFGEHDAVIIVELPNNEAAAAVAIAAAAGGGVRSVKTTVLMTPAEGLAAMRKAKSTGYEPPK